MAKTRSVGPSPAQKRVLKSIDEVSKRSKALAALLDELSANLSALETAQGGEGLAARQIWIGPWCPPPPNGGKKKR